MLHPDYQYDGSKIKQMIEPILTGEYDIMIGSRIRTRQEALKGGMPLEKYIGNRIMTTADNIILGLNNSEHLSGFRAYSYKVLKTIPFQRFSNDFDLLFRLPRSVLKSGKRRCRSDISRKLPRSEAGGGISL